MNFDNLNELDLYCEKCNEKKKFLVRYKCTKCNKILIDYHKPKTFQEMIKSEFVSGNCPTHGPVYLTLDLAHKEETKGSDVYCTKKLKICKGTTSNFKDCKCFLYKNMNSFNIVQCYNQDCQYWHCWHCLFSSKNLPDIYKHIQAEHPFKFFEH